MLALGLRHSRGVLPPLSRRATPAGRWQTARGAGERRPVPAPSISSRQRRRLSTPSTAGRPAPAAPPLRIGDVLRVKCSRLGSKNEGVCFAPPNEFALLCAHAVPGEVVEARVTRVQKTFAEGVKLATVTPAAAAATPPCTYFGTCGGCTLQALAYEAQLREKRARLVSELQRLGRVVDAERLVRPGLASKEQLRYRNKVSFVLAATPHGPQLALQRALSRDCVPVAACLLQSRDADDVLTAINAALARGQPRLVPFDEAARHGFVKRIVLRTWPWTSDEVPLSAAAPRGGQTTAAPATTHAVLVDFVTAGRGSRGEQEALERVSRTLLDAPPRSLTGIVQTVSSFRSSPALATDVTVPLAGASTAALVLGDITLRAPPQGFLQINAQQAAALGAAVEAAAALERSDTVVDLYTGCGTWALLLAQRCARVVGIDVVASGIEAAQRNAASNGVTNAEFHVRDLHEGGRAGRVLSGLLRSWAPDVVIVDPARRGLSHSSVEALRRCAARRLVYVSCNGESFARDTRSLCAAAAGSKDSAPWRLTSVQPVDMFPNTHHCESVAAFERAL